LVGGQQGSIPGRLIFDGKSLYLIGNRFDLLIGQAWEHGQTEDPADIFFGAG
jgi:hypothetical protein